MLFVNGVQTGRYLYDWQGRQIVRKFVQANITIDTVFQSDGQRIAEYNSGTGALIREYVWLGDRPLAVIEGGQVYLVRVDHVGRPAFATTLAGAQVWSASYLPFGGVHVTTGAPIDLRFPGQWFQTESGLYQNWMRDYDPTTGRYIEADPLGLVDGASIYGYARQNPGRWVDPRGEFAGLGRYVGQGVKWISKRLKFDGPAKSLSKHGNGRVFQLRWKSSPLFRLDFDEYRRGEGPELHCHVLGIESVHIPLDPRRIPGDLKHIWESIRPW